MQHLASDPPRTGSHHQAADAAPVRMPLPRIAVFSSITHNDLLDISKGRGDAPGGHRPDSSPPWRIAWATLACDHSSAATSV